jgi:hypothetical protein
MSAPIPLIFQWSGEAMVPQRPKLADREYIIGEVYRLGVIEERSTNSHSHFFAAVHDAWNNLPEGMMDRYPTPEHLRRAALIATGWCDSHTLVCSSKAGAQRVAAFMRPVDEFAVVVAKEATVTRYIAKSQSYRAMGKEDFQASKTAVLDHIASLIGVKPEALSANAGRAA